MQREEQGFSASLTCCSEATETRPLSQQLGRLVPLELGEHVPCPFNLPGLVIKVSFQFSKERVMTAPTYWSGRLFKERYWA